MRKLIISTIIGIAAVAVSVSSLMAHHSSAMFDQTRTITVEGVVKKWELTNPHSWLWVEEKDGKTVVWGFEAEGPSTLQRAGIRPSDFKVGTQLKITGNPMKNGEKEAIWINAI